MKKLKVLDRTKALYGPRTQAYGETNYLLKNQSFWTDLGVVWSSDSSLWGNQLPEKKPKILDRTKALYGPRTQGYGETNNLSKNQWFWTKLRYCMVLGLKPMGKSTTKLRKPKFWGKTEFRKVGNLIKNSKLLNPRLKYHKRLRLSKLLRRWWSALLLGNLVHFSGVRCLRMITSCPAPSIQLPFWLFRGKCCFRRSALLCQITLLKLW